jgi:hypothetical protein
MKCVKKEYNITPASATLPEGCKLEDGFMRKLKRVLLVISIFALSIISVFGNVPGFSAGSVVFASEIEDYNYYYYYDEDEDYDEDYDDEETEEYIDWKLEDFAEDASQKKEGTARIGVSVEEGYKAAFEVLDYVNEMRAEEGEAPLTMDTELLKTAMVRAAETSVYNSHDRPDKTDCETANSLLEAENIAAGQESAYDVMCDWMWSPGHCANILNEDFVTIGVGCVCVDGIYYWVQDFSSEEGTAAVATDYTDRTIDRTIYVAQDILKKQVKVKLKDTTVAAGSTGLFTVSWKNNLFLKNKVISSGAGLEGTSSDPEICTVSDGKIIAKNTGKAVLNVYYPDYPALKFKLTVKVRARYPKDTPIYLKAKSTGNKYKISVGQKVILNLTGLEEGNHIVCLRYDDAAWIDNGDWTNNMDETTFVLSGKKAGKAKIVIKDQKGKQTKMTVTVTKKKIKTEKITGLKKNITMKVGEEIQLNPKIKPVTSQQKISFSSNKKSIASVDDGGTITAGAAGSAKITIKSGSKKFIVNVEVE